VSALLQPGWRERYGEVGGLRLHLVEAGPEDGRPLILLHGFPEFWWAWRRVLGPLGASGFRVIAPDMRGYNLSDAPAGIDAYRTERLAGDIAGLAGALGLERFSLVGHDWGGLVAWAFAARHPDRLERLVIMDAPHPGVWARYMMRHPTQAMRSAYVGWFQLPVLPETMLRAFGFAMLRSTMQGSARGDAFRPGELDRYAESWAEPGRLTAMLNYYRALRLPGSGTVGRVQVPTLILWGGRDRFLDNALAHESAGMVANARIEISESGTHWLHLEEPDWVAGQVTAFCASRTAAPAPHDPNGSGARS